MKKRSVINKFFFVAIVLIVALISGMPVSMYAQCGITYPRVSLVTVDPGREIYELEGHTGLRLVTKDFDMIVNWGVFDFNSPNFVYRFVKGETDYLCVAENTGRFLSRYQIYEPGRGISEQVIPLDSVQSMGLLEAIGENLSPEKREYRYNYVKDNCALRPVRLLEEAAGERLLSPSVPSPFREGMTFRDVMTYYHTNYPWYQFGIDLALGSGIDYPLSPDEYAFAPVIVRDMLPYPSEVIVPSEEGGITGGPTPLLLSPDVVSIIIALLIINITVFFYANRRLVSVVYTVWFSLLAMAGCLIFFLVFISSHEATSPNFNLLWLNPLCVLGALSVWINKPKIVWDCYHFANFALILAYVGVWICGIQAGNSAFVPLLVTDAFLSARYLLLSFGKLK